MSPNNIKVYDQNGSLLGANAIANKITIYTTIWEGYNDGNKPIFSSEAEAIKNRYTIHADENIFDFYIDGQFLSGCLAPTESDDCFFCANVEGCSIDPTEVDFCCPAQKDGEWILGDTPAYKLKVQNKILGYVAFHVIEP